VFAAAMTHHDVDVGGEGELNVYVDVDSYVISSEDKDLVDANDFIAHQSYVLFVVWNGCLSITSYEAIDSDSVSRAILVHVVHVNLDHFRFVREADYDVVININDLFNDCDLNEFMIVLPRTLVVTVINATIWIRNGLSAIRRRGQVSST